MECPNCYKEMLDYSNPQDPFYVCPNCGSSASGLEVAWCDCGEPYVVGDDKRCDCEDTD